MAYEDPGNRKSGAIQEIKRIAYEAAVTAWDIYIGLAPITIPVTLILFTGIAWKLLGW